MKEGSTEVIDDSSDDDGGEADDDDDGYDDENDDGYDDDVSIDDNWNNGTVNKYRLNFAE